MTYDPQRRRPATDDGASPVDALLGPPPADPGTDRARGGTEPPESRGREPDGEPSPVVTPPPPDPPPDELVVRTSLAAAVAGIVALVVALRWWRRHRHHTT